MAFEEGDIFIDEINLETEELIEGNCWGLCGALFGYLSGDLHHGTARYIIEGVRIAFTKYGYETEHRIFRNKEYARLLNYQFLTLGFTVERGEYKPDYQSIEKGLLDYLPPINEKLIIKEYDNLLDKDIYSIPYNYKKLGCLYFVIDFVTRVNSIMSRMEADPVGTIIFDTLKGFRIFLFEQFSTIDSSQFVDYQDLFAKFLELKENNRLKAWLNKYHKAKIVSYLDVNAMLDIGENEQIEFKEEVTNKLYKEAIAFSNTSGGKILIGVSDNKDVLGIENISESSKKAMNNILGNTNPKISPFIMPHKVNGKDILVIEIHPFSKVVQDNDNNTYIRKGETNQIASKFEFVDLMKNRGELSSEEKKEVFTLDFVENKIIHSIEKDWVFDEEKGVYTYSKDVKLSIKFLKNGESFYEPWMSIFADKSGYRATHEIYYSGSFIKKIYFVGIDGSRCYIPYPNLKNMRITKFAHKVGKILNYFLIPKGRNIPFGSYKDYLIKAGIKII